MTTQALFYSSVRNGAGRTGSLGRRKGWEGKKKGKREISRAARSRDWGGLPGGCGLKIGQRQGSGTWGRAAMVGKKTRSRGRWEVEEVEARGQWCSTGTRDGLTGPVSWSVTRGRYGVRGPETLLLVW